MQMGMNIVGVWYTAAGMYSFALQSTWEGGIAGDVQSNRTLPVPFHFQSFSSVRIEYL